MTEEIKQIKTHLSKLYKDFHTTIKPLEDKVNAFHKLEREKLLTPYLGKYYRKKEQAKTPELLHNVKICDMFDFECCQYFLNCRDGQACLYAERKCFELKDILAHYEEISEEQFLKEQKGLIEAFFKWNIFKCD